DMIKRQGTEKTVIRLTILRTKFTLEDTVTLQHVRNQITMRQFSTFRYTRGTTCVLQNCSITKGQCRTFIVTWINFRQGRIESHMAWNIPSWNLLAHRTQYKVH